jgi:hypothetical protein
MKKIFFLFIIAILAACQENIVDTSPAIGNGKMESVLKDPNLIKSADALYNLSRDMSKGVSQLSKQEQAVFNDKYESIKDFKELLTLCKSMGVSNYETLESDYNTLINTSRLLSETHNLSNFSEAEKEKFSNESQKLIQKRLQSAKAAGTCNECLELHYLLWSNWWWYMSSPVANAWGQLTNRDFRFDYRQVMYCWSHCEGWD